MEENTNFTTGNDANSTVQPDGIGEKKIRFRIAMVGFILFLVFVVGIFWFVANPELGAGLSLSFIAGLTMIFLPCTLPMAFVIVPMTMGKAPLKGFLMALSFGLGLSITLSFYGVFIAYVGQFLGLTAATQLMLIIGGGAALLFGLSEIRLLKFRLPAYSGKFPDFIQKQGDYIKVFLLGLFLGNAGVGCPNPAFYVLMGYIATVGDLFNGWLLGFIHGVGRAVPLIFLAILGILGINATSKLTGKQESIERYMGWVLILIGSFILTFGLFGHDWFVSSGIHTSWEKAVVKVAGEQFGENVLQHTHKLVDIDGFIEYGNMFFLALIGVIVILFAKFQKPSKKFLRNLLILYALLVLSVGYVTGWTFKLSPDATGHAGGHGDVAEEGAGGDHEDDHTASDGGEHVGHTSIDSSQIAKLPIRTPENRVDTLPFVIKDGIKEFRLTAGEFRWEYEPGKYVHAWGYNGQIPGPEIRVNKGDRVRVILKNNLPEATTIHWHSLDVEWEADGVPNLTQEPVQPGETYTYEFTATPGGTGTRFYHSHGKSDITAAQQMDMGLTGPFIVEEEEPVIEYDREYTLLLDEWNILEGGVNPALGHVHGAGSENAVPDYNTFTINGRIFPYIDSIKVKEGERVLIRVINTGTTAFHPMHTHGHSFELVGLDGFPVKDPQRRATYTVHPGETADFLLTADNPGNWLFHCHHVHHASAGMIMLVEYEGFEGPTIEDLRDMANEATGEGGGHAHKEDVADDHPHGGEISTAEAGSEVRVEESHEQPSTVEVADDGHTDHSHGGGITVKEATDKNDFIGDGHTDHSHTPVSRAVWYEETRWWALFLSSLVLMALLSFGVRKYLQTK